MPESRTPANSQSSAPRTRKAPRKGSTAASAAAAEATAVGTAEERAVVAMGVDRDALVARAAYFRAQHRCFEPGHELVDWLGA